MEKLSISNLVKGELYILVNQEPLSTTTNFYIFEYVNVSLNSLFIKTYNRINYIVYNDNIWTKEFTDRGYFLLSNVLEQYDIYHMDDYIHLLDNQGRELIKEVYNYDNLEGKTDSIILKLEEILKIKKNEIR